MIPPSIIFVIYGIMTEQSIGKLLMSGVLPGIVETILFVGAIAAGHGVVAGARRARPSRDPA